MTDEQLTEYERWAKSWSREYTFAGRLLLQLVAEVRRLKAAAVPAECPPPPEVVARLRQAEEKNGRRVALMSTEQPAAVPPFHGILDGITAADVYGVHV